MFWSGEASVREGALGMSGGRVLRGKGKSICKGSEESGVLEEQLENQCGWNRVTESGEVVADEDREAIGADQTRPCGPT